MRLIVYNKNSTILPLNYTIHNNQIIGEDVDASNMDLRGLKSDVIDFSKVETLPAEYTQIDGKLYGPGIKLENTVINTDLRNVDLSHVETSGLTLGTDALLPSGVKVISGHFIGPNTNLTNADLSSANLSNIVSGGIAPSQTTYIPFDRLHIDNKDVHAMIRLQDDNMYTYQVIWYHGQANTFYFDTSLIKSSGRMYCYESGTTNKPESAYYEWYYIGNGSSVTWGSSSVPSPGTYDLRIYPDHANSSEYFTIKLIVIESASVQPILPSGYKLVNGYIVGPNMNLTNTVVSQQNLDTVNLTGSDLTNVRGSDITGTSIEQPVVTNHIILDDLLIDSNLYAKIPLYDYEIVWPSGVDVTLSFDIAGITGSTYLYLYNTGTTDYPDGVSGAWYRLTTAGEKVWGSSYIPAYNEGGNNTYDLRFYRNKSGDSNNWMTIKLTIDPTVSPDVTLDLVNITTDANKVAKVVEDYEIVFDHGIDNTFSYDVNNSYITTNSWVAIYNMGTTDYPSIPAGSSSYPWDWLTSTPSSDITWGSGYIPAPGVYDFVITDDITSSHTIKMKLIIHERMPSVSIDSNYLIQNGQIIGPSIDLKYANLIGVDLSSFDFSAGIFSGKITSNTLEKQTHIPFYDFDKDPDSEGYMTVKQQRFRLVWAANETNVFTYDRPEFMINDSPYSYMYDKGANIDTDSYHEFYALYLEGQRAWDKAHLPQAGLYDFVVLNDRDNPTYTYRIELLLHDFVNIPKTILPENYKIINGFIVGPNANLSEADFSQNNNDFNDLVSGGIVGKPILPEDYTSR
jgi:uncharacterized protein YjbI with pentapeptide repeats